MLRFYIIQSIYNHKLISYVDKNNTNSDFENFSKLIFPQIYKMEPV